MILEERLKELLGQKIYCIFRDDYKIEEITVKQCYINICDWFENLYETKEQAEFALKFKRIPKTEYLDLPTWEEFITKDKTITFYKNQVKYQMYIFVKNKNTNNCRIIIYADDNSQDWFVFEKSLNKENFLEACRLCRKLFLGEQ